MLGKRIPVLLILTCVLAVACGCAGAKKDYERARQVDTIAAYQDFLHRHPDSDYTKPATTRIEKIKFEKAESENTVAAYRRFIDGSNSDLFKNYANQRILDIYTDAYEKARSDDTIAAYETYLESYPQSPFAKESVNRIDELMWGLAIKGKNVLSYYQYLYNCKYCKQYEKVARKRLKLWINSGDKVNPASVQQLVEKMIQREDIVVSQKSQSGMTIQSGPQTLADLGAADEVLIGLLADAENVTAEDLARGTYRSTPKMRLKNSLPDDNANAIGFDTIILYAPRKEYTQVIFISDGHAYAFKQKGLNVY